ncbi:hypothetical protein Pla110_42920 [Polystyrenella longa]|uniref:DUF4265 domain-containing protein n=1 Tax=Polystyrenella longa TaxID=2528007 RepID=A0A518CTN7_9PLAN|nr:DUF4265 domain-containing protein [Polystyrenella longa]QDU82534.1 hypothetical protein Pla110_42920 [Polystyrenella longa]
MKSLNHQIKDKDALSKINFLLEQDEDGWPPVTAESLWAIEREEGMYEIANIPFFVRGIAYGDIVKASTETGELIFEEKVEYLGHITLRIILYDLSCMKRVCEELEKLGCDWEGSHLNNLISVDVPPQSEYENVLEFLRIYIESEQLEYEEGAIPE